MHAEIIWNSFFKPETCKQGEDYFQKGLVHLQNCGDLQIQAVFKNTARTKVQFKSETIETLSFNADCSCSAANKGKLCPHVYATLLAVIKKHPDFLDSKNKIIKTDLIQKREAPNQHLRPVNANFLERQKTMKSKQSAYRKEQYQKIKELKKSQKYKKSMAAGASGYPEEIQCAMDFFSQNGFEFNGLADKEAIHRAWKTLARVFHPDKGGSHSEALALNENYQILMAWNN